MRAAFAEVFAGMSAARRADQRERVALILSVPGLRAAMLDQLSQAMDLWRRRWRTVPGAVRTTSPSARPPAWSLVPSWLHGGAR
jgi:hypothetical protein